MIILFQKRRIQIPVQLPKRKCRRPVCPLTANAAPSTSTARAANILTAQAASRKAANTLTAQAATTSTAGAATTSPASSLTESISTESISSIASTSTADVVIVPTVTSSTSTVTASTSTAKPTTKARPPKTNSWVPLTLSEFYGFIGVLIIMGYHKLPEIRLYWSTSRDMGVQAVRDAFTLVRFQQIWNRLHYSGQPSYHHQKDTTVDDERGAAHQKSAETADDAVMKVRTFMSLVNRRFRAVRNPSACLCVDETITPYKGRSSIKVSTS